MSASSNIKILRPKLIWQSLNISRSAFYDRLDPKSPRYDTEFPRPFRLGNGTAVGVMECDLIAWIELQRKKGIANACNT